MRLNPAAHIANIEIFMRVNPAANIANIEIFMRVNLAACMCHFQLCGGVHLAMALKLHFRKTNHMKCLSLTFSKIKAKKILYTLPHALCIIISTFESPHKLN